jgi:hypothetical protein
LAPGSYNYSFTVTVDPAAADGAVLSNTAQVDYLGETASIPANGNNVTVIRPTDTPTRTATPSSTPTVSATPTATRTNTPILHPTICPIYPNPATSAAHASFCIEVPGDSEVKVTVYTIAFRKVFERTLHVAKSTDFTWDMRDQWGSPVANGLYYVRVQITGPVPTTKMMKLLINH